MGVDCLVQIEMCRVFSSKIEKLEYERNVSAHPEKKKKMLPNLLQSMHALQPIFRNSFSDAIFASISAFGICTPCYDMV